MEIWTHAFKVAGIGVGAVFIGLWMLTAGVKIMTYCIRNLEAKKKGE